MPSQAESRTVLNRISAKDENGWTAGIEDGEVVKRLIEGAKTLLPNSYAAIHTRCGKKEEVLRFSLMPNGALRTVIDLPIQE